MGRASDAPWANPTTTQRSGDGLSAPPPQRPRKALEGAARVEGDEAFRAKHQLPTGSQPEDCIHFTESGTDHACRHPLWRWPAYEELFPMDKPTRFLRHLFSTAANLRGLPRDHVLSREENPDPYKNVWFPLEIAGLGGAAPPLRHPASF